MSFLTAFLLGAACVLVAIALFRSRFSFRAQRPENYDGAQPAFDIRQHLNGPILCEGVIYGLTGRVTSRFVADIVARWDGNVGIMSETFRYDSGLVQDRQWTLTLGNDGAITATAPDVVGTGRGQQKGSAVLLNYKIRLTEDAGGHVLDTTDWMYLAPNGTIINRSQFRKFGIQVAELVATMRRKEAV